MLCFRPSQDCGRSETGRGLYARLGSVPAAAVSMRDGFWRQRMEVNRQQSIPAHLERMECHGFLDNFRRVSGRVKADRRGRFATDADVFKWIEAACHALRDRDDAGLRGVLASVIDDVCAAQQEDGYLNTWYVGNQRHGRLTELETSHEFFNLGHLIQAGIACCRTFGDMTLLDAACRFADLVTEVFRQSPGEGRPGHNGLEMAMVELYRVTGRQRYLDFARTLLEWDGFAGRDQITGHCVQTTYLCAGAADYYQETGDLDCIRTLERLWMDMIRGKIHVHGGIGSRYFSEDFGFAFQLPTLFGFSETCASVGSILWNARMLAIGGEGQFADLIETILYNAFLSGVSLEGTDYFYVNPLASTGDHRRRNWQDIPCCLPNVQRVIASVPAYFFSTSDDGVWVHLYDNTSMAWHLPDGRSVRVEQETGYPWNGRIVLTVDIEGDRPASLFVRIPGWSIRPVIRLNGQEGCGVPIPGRYCEIRRSWKKGDRIDVDFGMEPVLLAADARVRDHVGCVAVRRGPLVYCLEGQDHADGSVLGTHINLSSGCDSPEFGITHRADLLGGVTTIVAPGLVFAGLMPRGSLYAPIRYPIRRPREVCLTFIPYYAWCNRGPSEMTVWVPAAMPS